MVSEALGGPRKPTAHVLARVAKSHAPAVEVEMFKVPTHSTIRYIRTKKAVCRFKANASGLPSERQQASASASNSGLARRLQLLLKRDEIAYRYLQNQTAKFREGQLSAAQLQDNFRKAIKSKREADLALGSLAALLPVGSKQASLLAVLRDTGTGTVDKWEKVEINRALVNDQLQKASTSVAAGKSDSREHMPLKQAQQPGKPAGPEGARRVKQKCEHSREARAVKGQGVLLWVRSDLRIHDNPALDAAARRARSLGGSMAICFIHSPEEDGDDLESGTSWRPAGASLVWQQASLKSLDADLQARYGPGAAIIYQKGPYLHALRELLAALNIGALYFSRRYEPAMRDTDKAVQAELASSGVEVHTFNTTLLHEPEDVRIAMGPRWVGHFGTLSPFLRACEKLGTHDSPLPAPRELPVARESPCKRAGSLSLEQLGMVPLPIRKDGTVVRWDAPILDAWEISESGALGALEDFASVGMKEYEASRQFADARAVSRLSAYIHWGQVSARQVLAAAARQGGRQISKTFWRRLVWRDLAYWQLFHWPQMSCTPIRFYYEAQEWRHDAAALAAWQKGQTGFPLVDAGMRQLYQTGWMQQSVRMVCAAFLTEYLNIHWVHGCRWFHKCLVDADLAINSMMWQNAGKSGLDQWNFTLLPTSSTQDPDGAYTVRWVPEVAKLPKKYVHQPWLASPEAQQSAGLVLGETYPARITGNAVLQDMRKENAEAIRKARQTVEGEWIDSAGYDMITVPKGATTDKDGDKIKIFTKRDYRNLQSA